MEDAISISQYFRKTGCILVGKSVVEAGVIDGLKVALKELRQ